MVRLRGMCFGSSSVITRNIGRRREPGSQLEILGERITIWVASGGLERLRRRLHLMLSVGSKDEEQMDVRLEKSEFKRSCLLAASNP